MIDNAVELPLALCALIQSQLNLTADRGWIYNQKQDIPTDDGLFFSVACLRDKPFASSLDYENVPATETAPAKLQEVQSINTQETYRIMLFSRDASARQRRHEMVFVMHSTAAQQLQERYSCRFGYIPLQMTDISAIEGAARINRYSLTFSLTRAYTRTKPIEYFDTFTIPPTLIIEP